MLIFVKKNIGPPSPHNGYTYISIEIKLQNNVFGLFCISYTNRTEIYVNIFLRNCYFSDNKNMYKCILRADLDWFPIALANPVYYC